jgi:hypothetical protein
MPINRQRYADNWSTIAIHGGRNGNISPGQLSLFHYIYENGVLKILPNPDLLPLT